MWLGRDAAHDAVDAGGGPVRAEGGTVFRTPIIVKVAVATLVLSAPVAACGDDNPDTAATTAVVDTVASAVSAAAASETFPSVPEDAVALVKHFETECTGADPGFDQFMTEHPEPTAAEWAAFLPKPHTMLVELSACIADSDPPARLADDVDNVVETMNVVADDLAAALDAAEAGDLERVNAVLEEMNSGHTEAMQQAQDAFGEAVQGG
jgi:hypothetical protein